MTEPASLPDGWKLKGGQATESDAPVLPAGWKSKSRVARPNLPAPAMAEPALSWGEVASQALQNTPDSAVQLGKDIIHPITHPKETIEAIGGLGEGLWDMAFTEGRQESEAVPEALGQFFVDRYGSMENFKKTLARDPVGVLADVSTVLTAGGTAAVKGAQMIGKTGQIAKAGKAVSTLGKAIDPVSIAGKAVRQVGRGVGKVASEAAGLTTGQGGEAFRVAAKAGRTSKAATQAFLDNLRNKVPAEDLVQDAKAAVRAMREERGRLYRDGMTNISKDATILDMKPIQREVRKIQKMGQYKGQEIRKGTSEVFTELAQTVDEWANLDPTDYHTVEGLDALKQKVGSIVANTEYGKPQHAMAKQVYDAVKGQIRKQAPEYTKVMREYEAASDAIAEIERGLSVNNKALKDTALRKLTSIMRHNVNTNYGQRVKMVEMLDEAGGKNLKERVAGQALNSWTPHGLNRLTAGAAALGGGYIDPALLYTLPFQSPRIMGETAVGIGIGARKAGDAVAALPDWVQQAGAAAVSPQGRAIARLSGKHEQAMEDLVRALKSQ